MEMSLGEAEAFFRQALERTDKKDPVREPLEAVLERLHFLNQVGLDYLTLDRKMSTLSGGESQRAKLATQLGMGPRRCDLCARRTDDWTTPS